MILTFYLLLSFSSTALCFTCAWYSSIVTGGLLHLLLVQVINISYNVTEREARLALRDRSARRAYCGLVVDTGVYSRGFTANWTEFWQMVDTVNLPSPAPTDMVWEGVEAWTLMVTVLSASTRWRCESSKSSGLVKHQAFGKTCEPTSWNDTLPHFAVVIKR